MASPTVTVEDSTIKIPGNDSICLHTWNGNLDENEAKGLVLIFHGFGAHGLYPTVRYAAERLAVAKYIVVAPDMPGHGKSSGLKGYISSAPSFLQAGVDIALQVQEKHVAKSGGNFFLLGSSMGGTISLSVAQKLLSQENNTSISGVVLLAPMLMLSVGTPARYLLSSLATIPGLNTMQLIPSNSTDPAQQYRDVEKRKECVEDSLSVSGNMRLGSASACVEMAAHIQSQFSSITLPFLCMIGDEDVVVKNQGSLDLMEKSPSQDKTMKRFPALHGLLCEPKPLVDTIQDDMIEWMNSRTK